MEEETSPLFSYRNKVEIFFYALNCMPEVTLLTIQSFLKMATKKHVLLGITILSSLTSIAQNNTEVDFLPNDTVLSLQEVVIRGNFSDERRSALNLTTIRPDDILRHSTAPNYLEMMQGVPGVYATSSTGTYGDATLNMRGFKQENISILLNGIPIQGLTSGSMYWSNWMGLAEATYAVQIQKGLGSSMLADTSMGGAVNIITKRNGNSPRTNFGFSATQYGTFKGNVNYSSGKLANGWGVDLSLAYVTGSGYVEASEVQTFSYMLSVNKILNDNNTLIFTALGSPESHDQRNTELTSQEVEKYGRDYSKNWGVLRGKDYSIGRNHYWKPYFTLQHIMEGERLNLKNSIYLAIADGGGRSTYAASGATSIIKHQDANGHIDFNSILEENENNVASKNIMIDYLSGHKQAGAIFSGDYKLTEEWTLAGGIQYQYYDTWSKMKILDLLGGTYWYDYSSKSNLGVGDYVGARYGRTTHHTSAYLQGKYDFGPWALHLGASVFNGKYRRHNDITGEKSDWANGFGANFKAGILYAINEQHSIYLNGGYNSRLPYASVYLASSNLSITNDVVNEKNIMGELGYRSNWNGGGLSISGYIASWKDKTLSVSITKRANEQSEKYLVKGLNALHMGLELDVHQRINQWLTAKAYGMLASWKWKSSGEAIIYDSYTNETLNTYTINCDGLHVGDAPQTQFGASLDMKLRNGFYANLGWQHNARMYADFEPSSRTSNSSEDAYLLPSYSLINATIGWRTNLSKDMQIDVFANGTNLLDKKYIERGIDGANHDLATFKGYWGTARAISGGFRISF